MNKWILLTVLGSSILASLAVAAVLASIALDHNPQGEHCKYEPPIDKVNWYANDLPCVLTSDFFVLIAVNTMALVLVSMILLGLVAGAYILSKHPHRF